jgi:hypothetical protein
MHNEVIDIKICILHVHYSELITDFKSTFKTLGI